MCILCILNHLKERRCEYGFELSRHKCIVRYKINSFRINKIRSGWLIHLVKFFNLRSFMYLSLDIDECKEYSLCKGNLHCTNTVGSYICGCRHGFETIDTDCSDQGYTCFKNSMQSLRFNLNLTWTQVKILTSVLIMRLAQRIRHVETLTEVTRANVR